MKRNTSKRKKLAIGLAALSIVGLAVVGYLVFRGRPANQPSSTKHFSGPTEQEKADADAHKDVLVQQMQQEKQDQSAAQNGTQTQKAVTPIITSAEQNGDQIRISGYVSGVLEDDGTCTITLTQAANKIEKTTKAFANVSTTQCSPLAINRSEFASSGNWSVTLIYNSAAAKGTSQVQTLAIQ